MKNTIDTVLAQRLPPAWREARLLALLGLGYGDEGKGSLTDFLVRATGASLVVRYNGGPQAAHHVVTQDGKWHCFAQFGAGTLVAGTRTFLAASMFVDPLALIKEEQALQAIGVQDAFARLVIDPACIVVTPFHALFNRLQETARGQARHGSCGLGVGEVFQDTLREGAPLLRSSDLSDVQGLRARLAEIQAHKVAAAALLLQKHDAPESLASLLADLKQVHLPALLADHYSDFLRRGVRLQGSSFLQQCVAQGERVVLEGAQGALLDMDYGFWPYVTPSSTTFAYATTLLADAGIAEQPLRLGILRAYGARHGAGPFPGESQWLSRRIPDQHNGNSRWQGAVRLGWFDAVMARYALRLVGGVDGLVMSNLDRLAGVGRVKVCHAYQYQGAKPADLAQQVDYQTQGEITQIMDFRLPPKTSLQQDNRTAILSACQPQYASYEMAEEQEPIARQNQRDYLRALETLLGRPVDLLSLGPTAWDKGRRDVFSAGMPLQA